MEWDGTIPQNLAIRHKKKRLLLWYRSSAPDAMQPNGSHIVNECVMSLNWGRCNFVTSISFTRWTFLRFGIWRDAGRNTRWPKCLDSLLDVGVGYCSQTEQDESDSKSEISEYFSSAKLSGLFFWTCSTILCSRRSALTSYPGVVPAKLSVITYPLQMQHNF